VVGGDYRQKHSLKSDAVGVIPSPSTALRTGSVEGSPRSPRLRLPLDVARGDTWWAAITVKDSP